MRDLMFLAGFLVLLPLSLSNAFAAYLVWGWASVIAIDSYLYGFMQNLRVSMTFGLVALTMILLNRDKVPRSSLADSGTFILILLFFFQATISVIFAYSGNRINFELYDKIFKTLLFVFVMPLVVVGRYRIHAVVVMLCLGMAFHGVIDGLKFFASGGGHLVRGLIKFGDNNHFAVAMAMVVPLLLYLSRYSQRRLIRLGAVMAALTSVATVIGTHSRGGLITLVALALWVIVNSRQRLAGVILFAAGIAIVVAFAPSSWSERMDTIQSADEDISFMTRIEAWQVSSAIALSNPLTGGGLHAVQVQSVWERFKGSRGLLWFVDVGFVSHIFRAAHSIYFEVLGDMGFLGLFIFLAIMFNGLQNTRRIKKLVKGRESEFEWAIDLSKAFSAVIVVFLVGGSSVSLAYSEVIYIVVMLSEVLRREVAQAVAMQPIPSVRVV